MKEIWTAIRNETGKKKPENLVDSPSTDALNFFRSIAKKINNRICNSKLNIKGENNLKTFKQRIVFLIKAKETPKLGS